MLRDRADQIRARLRTLGVRETLKIQQDVLRRIFKCTLAATLAWLAVELIGSPRPALASLAAILVVQLTVRSSLARAVQLTAAVTLGLIAALSIGGLLGLHWWTISIIVLAGLIVGEVLRLGALSAQVSISAMLALSLGHGYGIERATDTAIGAVVGAAVSVVLAPPSHLAEARRSLRAIGEDLGALLGEIGERLAERHAGPDAQAIMRWLSRARELAAASRIAIATVKQGEESLQFNPRARTELDQLQRLVEARRALDHVIGQTRGITRSLRDIDQPITDPHTLAVLNALGAMLVEAGRSVSGYGRLLARPSSTLDRQQVETARANAAGHARSVMAALAVAGPAAPAEPAFDLTARLLTSILVDGERLLDEVATSGGAHSAAVTDPDVR